MNKRGVIGLQGEQLALKYLQKQGLRLLERNYREPCGEIDLIMQHKKTIVFVEVKQRSDLRYGAPAEAVTPLKQRKISMTAALYLNKHCERDTPCRFDVVEILDGKINHIEHAFLSVVPFV